MMVRSVPKDSGWGSAIFQPIFPRNYEKVKGLAAKKRKSPTWTDVKAMLVNLDQKQLLKLIADLYKFSDENKTFLHTRFSVGEDQLGSYKKIIDDFLFPDVFSNKPIQVAKAKKAISSYSKALGDDLGQAELMVYFVECGNNFTLDFGDINEAFYDALKSMYQRAIDKVLSLPVKQQSEFKRRLKEIMTSSSGIGWGYHDTLADDYYRAFPEDK
jgi:hypothetical protein